MKNQLVLMVAFSCLLTTASPTSAQNFRISEFIVANNGSLIDENGDASDWIEIKNTTTGAAISVDGFSRMTPRS